MFTLYKFELRKIIKRKIFWITGGILLIGLLLWAIANSVLPQSREYSDKSLNGYKMNHIEQQAADKIAGREIDQSLINEMSKNYEEFIFNGAYEKALPYIDIYNFISETLGTHASEEILKVDSDILYYTLNEQLKENTTIKLSESYLFDNPIIYQGYFDGWRQLANILKVLACMEIMFIVISLSTVFTIEHIRKTDQLILCSRYGKKKLYIAKIFAGLTVSILFTLILSLFIFGIISVMYGFNGYNTILQFILMRPFDLTIGQSVIILIGLSFIATVLVSIFCMVLSELTKNNVATIGIITGIMILTMFISEMPSNFKVLYEIWYLLPSNLISLNGAFRYCTLNIG